MECRSYEEAVEAIESGADIVMLDNFNAKDAADCAQRLKNKWPAVLIEVSGGLTEETVEAYMAPGIDVLSLGALSQSVPHVDFSLKVSH